MKKRVWIIPHSHYDAEVFLVEEATLAIGYANLVGALHLLASQPTFKYSLDQSCFMEPLLQAYPELKQPILDFIHQGRLEIVGGMHSMPDENIPCGESFIRNVQHGKAFFQREFGVDVRSGWPIDTFGHHPQIPQLMRQCGFDHASFQRLMPKDHPSEFYWQGLDGTQLLCHWMTCSYAAFWSAPANLYEFTRFANDRIDKLARRAITQEIMAPAGADLTAVEPHLVEMVKAYNQSQGDVELILATVSDYYQSLHRAIQSGIQLPIFSGDLNPIFQGCYSARVAIKKWNRQVETQLLNAEKLSAITRLACSTAPQQERLLEAWKGVVFNQAHDDVCGCHTDPVFHNIIDRFTYSQGLAKGCIAESLNAISQKINTSGAGIPVIVINTLSWIRTDVVEIDVAVMTSDTFELAVTNPLGEFVPSDLTTSTRYENGSIKSAHLLFIAKDIPSLGYAVYHIVSAAGITRKLSENTSSISTSHPYDGLLRFEIDHGWMENEFYRIEFDLWKGVITRLYDKTNAWEVIASNPIPANTVVKELDSGNFWTYNGPCKGDEFYPMGDLYPLPHENDAHADFAHRYLGDGTIHQGSAYAEFNIEHPFGSGRFGTRVRLYAHIPRIDIHTTLVNQDEKVRYRAVFPTSIQHGTITYEIPFGAISRPAGEYPAQNWVDLSNDSHGLTLVNCGLPGNNVDEGVLLLSLLKCTALEGGYGDMKLGEVTQLGFEKGNLHTFDYALVTHQGDWRSGRANQHGADFNTPLIAIKTAPHESQWVAEASFLEISSPNVILSALRECEDGLIARFYESWGSPSSDVEIKFAWPVKACFESDLLEQAGLPLEHFSGNKVKLIFKAYEIKTIHLKF